MTAYCVNASNLLENDKPTPIDSNHLIFNFTAIYSKTTFLVFDFIEVFIVVLRLLLSVSLLICLLFVAVNPYVLAAAMERSLLECFAGFSAVLTVAVSTFALVVRMDTFNKHWAVPDFMNEVRLYIFTLKPPESQTLLGRQYRLAGELHCMWRTLLAVGRSRTFYKPAITRSLTSSLIAVLLLLSGVDLILARLLLEALRPTLNMSCQW